MGNNISKTSIYSDIRRILQSARKRVYDAVNSEMVEAYWRIGKRIVEEEQGGAERAKYGKKQLEQLSEQLTVEFGKGFNVRNLRNMRTFYQTYPIRNALRTELNWTHYPSGEVNENISERDRHRIKSILKNVAYTRFMKQQQEAEEGQE
jgi:hypothetical protein